MTAQGKPGATAGGRNTTADNEGATEAAAGHEGQVHHRNRTAGLPGEDGYVGVPPGEEGQYGMRRDDADTPRGSDDDASISHSASERDSHYAQWRKQHPESAGTIADFEAWRRAQTAPGTNVGPPAPDGTSPKKQAE